LTDLLERHKQTDLQSRKNLASHGAIEGVELLGSVELNAAETVDGIEQNIVGLIAGELFGDFGGSRHLE
jgi:hypothetical protein